jgi:hypothetical protein
MSKETRRALIKQIEEARGSRVLTYITGDRGPVGGGQIGDDAIRPMYDQLRSIGKVKILDLFLYSRGGAIDVPWRLVTAFRRWAESWNVLIPFRANSAATLTALGADEIVLGVHGELGPIDPIMNIQRITAQPGGGQAVVQDQVNVEDVMAYLKFAQERGQLNDQAALTASLSKLTDRIDAVALGNVYRTHSHIRDVARRVLLSRSKPADEKVLNAIIESLAEKVYAHGHAIGLNAAREIGLPAVEAPQPLDDLMWNLLCEYEKDLKMLSPLDPASAVAQSDPYTEDTSIAVIESATTTYEMAGRIEIRAHRQMPPNLQVTMNLNLQLPAGTNLQQVPGNVQQALQQAVQQLQQNLGPQAHLAVVQALKQQAPIVKIEAAFREGKWTRMV